MAIGGVLNVGCVALGTGNGVFGAVAGAADGGVALGGGDAGFVGDAGAAAGVAVAGLAGVVAGGFAGVAAGVLCAGTTGAVSKPPPSTQAHATLHKSGKSHAHRGLRRRVVTFPAQTMAYISKKFRII
jgi:hypothetical protein